MKLIITLLLLPLFTFTQNLIDYNKISLNNYIKLSILLPNADSNNFSQYLFDLAILESSGNWKAVNGDYIGLWQMGTMSRKDVSKYINGITFDTKLFIKSPFIFNPNKQKAAIVYYIKILDKRMSYYITKYNNTYINGVHITKSGILSACHLVGMGNVKKYLDSNGKIIKKDANGKSLENYMIIFENYDF